MTRLVGTIVLAVFPEGERGRVMAIYAGISQVFLALGPLVGGLLTEYVTWRAVFHSLVIERLRQRRWPALSSGEIRRKNSSSRSFSPCSWRN